MDCPVFNYGVTVEVRQVIQHTMWCSRGASVDRSIRNASRSSSTTCFDASPAGWSPRSTRLLGPLHLALAEDVVQDASVTAMKRGRFEVPLRSKRGILQVAKHRALDIIQRDRRLAPLPPSGSSRSWTVVGRRGFCTRRE